MQTSVDLSQIPQPDIVEVPDFETALADIRALIVAAMPAELQASVSAALLLESEPMAALAQAFTYREIHLLQRINEAVRAVLLSSALGADLDQVAGNFDTERLLITEATDEADAVYESDEALRGRTLLSWARLSTAGARNAYHYLREVRMRMCSMCAPMALKPITRKDAFFSTCCHVPEMELPRRRCLIKSCQR